VSELALWKGLVVFSFVLAALVFTALFFINAPYGRHLRQGWGALIPSRLGWLLMESPSALLFGLLFWLGEADKTPTLWIFLAMWEAHYLYRAFFYPFRIADGRKKIPVLIVLMAVGFNCGNAYVNARYLFSFSNSYSAAWLLEPRFLAGLALFVAGAVINHRSDQALRSLRAPGESGYKIPQGGLFRWVSCPNYLGEIIEWAGWALATWSLPGLSFAVWTFANLAPRARANHIWYRRMFADYPAGRKALIPGVW
jgi:protein-S-isoprenylcysteine O-methyltransferase Ste14